MSFILKSRSHATLRATGWEWRPTLELLKAHGLIGKEKFDESGEDLVGEVSKKEAIKIAEFLANFLQNMHTQDRLQYDLTITSEPDTYEFYRDGLEKNYSTPYSWLVQFKDFCEKSKGFYVA